MSCSNMKFINIIGVRIGMLSVISENKRCDGQQSITYRCLCDCGNYCDVVKDRLNINNKRSTKSCGCIRGKNQKIGKDSSSWTGCGELSGGRWRHFVRTAMRRNKEFKITSEFAWNLYTTQSGKCALSGVSIAFPKFHRDNAGTASLDRIDSSIGYIAGNVQWVHKDVNMMKHIFSQDYFIEMCTKIANNKVTG